MYVIDQVSVSMDDVMDAMTYTVIWYESGGDGTRHGFNFTLSNAMLVHLTEEQPFILLSDAVSKSVDAPFEFTVAMKQWYENYKSKSKHKEWVHLGYVDEPYNFNPQYSKGGWFGPTGSFPEPPSGKAIKKKVAVNTADVSLLPGIKERVTHPRPFPDDVIIDCKSFPQGGTIRDVIIHLNDIHRWTREQIADWLETLDVDLRFKSGEDMLLEQETYKEEKQ